MQTYEKIILVGIIITTILSLMISINHEIPKDISKSNYLGLAKLGLIPNSPAPSQIGNHDIDTDVRANINNQSYALIKDPFGRIYAWRIK